MKVTVSLSSEIKPFDRVKCVIFCIICNIAASLALVLVKSYRYTKRGIKLVILEKMRGAKTQYQA